MEKQRDLLELNGKTASIIGFRSVGQAVAKRLSALKSTLLQLMWKTRV